MRIACNVRKDKRFDVGVSLIDRSLAPQHLNAVHFVAPYRAIRLLLFYSSNTSPTVRRHPLLAVHLNVRLCLRA